MTHFIQLPYRLLIGLFCLLCLSACAKSIPAFTSPELRPIAPHEQAWQKNHFLGLAYHDVEDEQADQAYLSVRTDHLIEQLTWLRENGYQAISVDQILHAKNGGIPLPEKAVLLTFDDGYRSFYKRVFPILKAFNWPAVLAPVGTWMDTPADQQVNFGGTLTERERFLTWQEISAMVDSNLVEIGAHTNNLHFGIQANPQGNTQPAAVIQAYDVNNKRYETATEFYKRVEADVAAITKKVQHATGKSPRVWVWPYGAESGVTLKVLTEQGYEMAFTLEDGMAKVDKLRSAGRYLLANDPSLTSFANTIIAMERRSPIRAVHVDLDYVYDADPEQMERNLGSLVQRIKDMQINTVYLQAFADPQGDGTVRSLYYPNRWLPMRADLFSRAAWQIRNRANVNVYAWMPVLSFDLDTSLPRVTAWQAGQSARTDPQQYQRLSPFNPEVRAKIGDLYEDLARHAYFDGILFHDDALFSDFEDASPDALAAYQQAGFEHDIERLRTNASTLAAWTRFKSRYLIDFTAELTQRIHDVRGPRIKTARNIFSSPLLDPSSESWFAQNVDDFLAAYDWVVPMAMPLMENIPSAQIDSWLNSLVDAMASRGPEAVQRTVFELQTRDWRSPAPTFIGTETIAAWIKQLQLRGANSFAYYPDDYVVDHPKLDLIRPALSDNWYSHHD